MACRMLEDALSIKTKALRVILGCRTGMDENVGYRGGKTGKCTLHNKREIVCARGSDVPVSSYEK
jgi:hypothetical protein